MDVLTLCYQASYMLAILFKFNCNSPILMACFKFFNFDFQTFLLFLLLL